MKPLLTADDVARLLAVDRKRVYELAAGWQPEPLRLQSIRFGRSACVTSKRYTDLRMRAGKGADASSAGAIPHADSSPFTLDSRTAQ
jgi:hypothetical protein